MPRRPLDEYRRKRDFSVTAEPAPREPVHRDGPLRFMVHKHQATRLHYDLRLELDGVLLSFAIPKGPSNDPKERRLAMHVEDHPLEYAGFEGVIPKGHYGGGPSLIWDSGTFSPDEGGPTYFDDREGAQAELRAELKAGKISVLLRGKKMKGSWALVHTKPATNEWLLLKHRDEAAGGPELTEMGESVASGLTIEQLAARPGATEERFERLGSPATTEGAKVAPLRIIEPMLALAAPIPARPTGWSFEPKMDGIRAVAVIDGGTVRLISRNGNDLTKQYPALAQALSRQPVSTALLDGEIVAISDAGRPSFERLQQRMNLQDPGQIAQMDRDIPVIYYTFDVMYLDGFDLMAATLKSRREILARTVTPNGLVAPIITIDASAEQAFAAAVGAGFEGIIAKRDSSKYEPGKRSGAWLKRKGLDRDVFLVCGYTPGERSRAWAFGGLVIGQRQADGTLQYCGRVGSGFTEQLLKRMTAELARLATEANPFGKPIPDAKGARWVRPEMEIVVEFSERTSAGVLRAPVFKGFAHETSLEVVSSPSIAEPDTGGTDEKAALLEQLERKAQKFTLEGDGWQVPLTNLDKELWPATSERRAVTKRDLLQYAVRASHLVLPHLNQRPLTLLRFPNGISGKKFYQRHWDAERPPFVDTVRLYSDTEGDRDFLLCNNLATLLWLSQIADIEWHASLARAVAGPDATDLGTTFHGSLETYEASSLNHPDFVLFDLDPYIYAGHEAKGAEPEPSRHGFAKTCEVAFAVKELLDSLGLSSYVKTSGATGIHIYVPVLRQFDYGVIRALAGTVFTELAAKRPKDVTLEWQSQLRGGKVFLDANQNARQKSLAAPYSPRAKPGAPASLPTRWADLGKVYPGDVSILDAWWVERDDPWGDIYTSRNDLEKVLGL